MAQEKKRAINRLQTMYPIRAEIDEIYKRSVEAVKAGEPTAWVMVNYWLADALFNAMDVAIVYPESYSAACAAMGAAQPYLDRCDEEGFPTHMCGYARNCIGYTARMMNDLGGEIPPEAPMGGMPKPAVLVSRGLSCDAGFKWFQALGRYLDVPMWTLEMPIPGVDEGLSEGVFNQNIQFIVKELRELVKFLERVLSKKMDWDKLSETVHDLEEIGQVWHETNELRKSIPCPMHSRDFWSCMNGVTTPTGDLKKKLELYRNLYDEVKYRVENKIGSVAQEKYRVGFTELPPWHSLSLFDTLAERGWNFVVETWGYHPPIPMDLTGVNDPLERLARISYGGLITSCFQGALQAGEYMGFLGYPNLEYAKEYKLDGFFLHPLLTCRAASAHLWYVQDRLMQKLKVPSLLIEGDIVDIRLFDLADALKKTEAFEEIMDHYKEVRKTEGME
jgi:benzoyl-CoA reductase/2-hydroxyglutaryl-CoA dehydratase subunit BcrC/BadD/HgdB